MSLPEHSEVFWSSYKSSGAISNISATEQLQKCSGAVSKVFRSNYESVLEQLVSILEQLVSVLEQLISHWEHL